MKDCPFCSGVISEMVFAESSRFLAIYNIAPVVPGHSLVLPRAHVESFLDLSDDEAIEMVWFSRRVARAVLRASKANAFDWTIQQGAAAGQTVPHLHLHIIARHVGDLPSPGAWYSRLREASGNDVDSEDRPRVSEEAGRDAVAALRKAYDEMAFQEQSG